MKKNLLRLKDLEIKEIMQILKDAQAFKDHKKKANYNGKIVANLFFESSTRTHYSFVVAEHKLGCQILDFAPASSSLNKGETFYDTIKTFDAFGVDALVIRSSQNEWYKQLPNINAVLLNGGDGTLDHPTQTLLDLLTIYQEFHKFAGLKILIVGDIAHSRVAHSNIDVMKRLGMEVYLSAPAEFQDKQYTYTDFDEAIKKVDIVNLLRIQNERLQEKMNLSTTEYNQKFGLNQQRLREMKPRSIIIHPAPFNRNVEINDDVVECSKSRIFEQMTNGVYVRMAVLDRAFKGK